ncbi:NmrA family NAD(P)-binding protein [Lentzea sp. NPDC051208]|uniref:SDR family oxidoreductase n=1 Tax=Lentzea sp. NPDC051208 TaxID=3154642 RepID=UPI0034257C33
MSNPFTVVVHGATGTQGAPVVRRLLADGHHVRAAVRRPGSASLPASVERVAADLLHGESLVKAYQGADAVVVQLPLEFHPDRAVAQAETVLAALKEAGVPRAVFNANGPLAPAPIGVPYVDARVTLATGLASHVSHAVVVAPGGPYMDNLAEPWQLSEINGAGVVSYPVPEQVPLPWVAIDDLAEVIARALRGETGELVVVAGPEVLTGAQVAEQISAAAGRPVRYRAITPAQHAEMTTPHLGAEAANGVAALYEARSKGAPPPAAAPATPGTTTFAAWAAKRIWTAP